MRRGRPSLRGLAHRTVPSHFGDPFGLAFRVVRSGGSDGRFAMFLAGLGLATTPVDLLLAAREQRLYDAAPPPAMPILFVCGPARSGTTVLAQALARALPVAYLTNVTALFPRSPITASRLLGARPRNSLVQLSSHYGRTARFRGPNDGLHLWDRWLGSDRTSTETDLGPEKAADITRFFGAFEQWSGRPLVTKNNSLNAHAATVAGSLPTARFVCLERDAVFLAQSLLIARRYIHGRDDIPYGLAATGGATADPVAAVCSQVRFHQQLAARQLDELGADRFRVLSYEAFCRDPRGVVAGLADDVLGVEANTALIPDVLQASRTRRLPRPVFDRIAEELGSGGEQ